jgi:hypothetical protein
MDATCEAATLRRERFLKLIAVGCALTSQLPMIAEAEPTPNATMVPSEPVDPFAANANRPIIAPLAPGTTYLGRVVVEMFARPNMPDSMNIAVLTQPVGIDGDVLLKRVTNALVARQSWPHPKSN